MLSIFCTWLCDAISCGILADEMGLGKTMEVIGLLLSHQRYKGLPPIIKNVASEVDTVKIIVAELVSTVVAATDGYSALQDKVNSRYRRMFCYDNLESMNPKKCKGKNSVLKSLIITCTACSTICSQERVYWDRFRSHDIPFLCPECIHNEERVYPVKGTLIIAPSTICHQWYEELKRHIRDDIKIDMYRGLVNDGYKHPEYLATQDVVICSFETLRKEVYFVEARPRLDSLRHGKRHRIAPTPLLAIEWWRICIDEAQMVESTLSSVALMCDDLKAVNRWCVTGTPITNSLQDLYGLVRFLGIQPFRNKCWWLNALMKPYQTGNGKPVIDFFSKIMWRNTKKTVGGQMLSPSKSNNLTVLRFTPIEEQFYRATLSSCRLKVRYMPYLHNLNTPISSLHGKDFEKLMEPLQILRKFIVFPSLRCQESKANVNTEESLQEELFRISTQQAEVHQRNILMYYCGLAGLEWLCGNKANAAKYYNGATSAMKELDQMNNKLGLKGSRCAYRQLRSDKLQQIHIFSAILDLQRDGVEVRGINQKEAEVQLNLAFTSYTEQTVSNLTQSYVAVNESSVKYLSILSEIKSSIGWLCKAISLINNVGQQHLFIDAIRTALENNGMPNVPASNLLGLNLYVVRRWDELIDCAQEVFSEMKKIAKNNITEKKWNVILEAIIACHFSLNDKLSKNCSLCIWNKQISQLESLLFIRGSKTSKNQDVDEAGTAGEQKISSLEIIIRTFLGTLIRMQKGMQCDLVGLGKETVAQLEELKSLLALSKRLYASANEYAAKIDEVRQCKLRLQYATEDEIAKYGFRLPINLIIRGTENDKRNTDLNALELEKLKQSRCLAKLRYLSNLRSQQTYDCPICLTVLRDAWIVYPCAHCLCVICFNRLTGRNGTDLRNDGLLVCVVCRSTTYISQISYVQSKASEKNTHLLDVPNIQLKRNVSIKIDAILRRIKSIRLRDPTSKTLLFTSLSMLINPLCGVLSENKINFLNFLGTNRQKILADFRLKPEIELLVIPMNLGARGLNLTVANHIIFVEPQMDISQIAQAIGRIDRIGQKKQMIVHHFVVYGSIEEQIYYKYSQDQDKDWTVQSIVHLLGLMGNNEEVMCDE
uniref:RING-type domain-containing protein n=1 Tax=Onchocerca volvulus TaxID=6282 RepID=A0A8R1U2N9_ONCVO